MNYFKCKHFLTLTFDLENGEGTVCNAMVSNIFEDIEKKTFYFEARLVQMVWYNEWQHEEDYIQDIKD